MVQLAAPAERVLPREQYACFESMSADVAEICSDRDRVDAFAQMLICALGEGSVDCWRGAVRAADDLIAAAPSRSLAAAYRRLAQFVSENRDLLR